jgi:CRP-like cAMP-binding protein
LSVKTPKKPDLESQVSQLMERFQDYTDSESARWDKVQTLMDSLGSSKLTKNTVNLGQEVLWRFLKSNDLFGGLPDEELAGFIAFGAFKTLEPGEWLFRAGGDCNVVVAIKQGVLEICREDSGNENCAALLGVGEVLGMLGALTGGRHRSSARFPEGGEVLVMGADNFDRAIETFPQLSAALTRSLARRLIGAVQRGDMSRAKKRHLEGSLAHFDMSMVLQSLFSTESCQGILKITSSSGELIGEIDVADGHVLSCVCGDFIDHDAFQHLFFADNSANRFAFEEVEVASDESRPKGEIAGVSGAGLLMDCARIADEMQRIKAGPLGDPDLILSRGEKLTSWQDPATKEIARSIWMYLESDHSVDEILAQGLGREHDVLVVIFVLFENQNLVGTPTE